MSGKIEISRELSESEFSAFWEQNKLDLLERKIGRSDCKAIWLEARKLAAPVVEPAKCGVCGQGAWACNEGGCHYLESGNGAPVVERQPVAIDERAEFENYYRERIMGNRTGVRFLRSASGLYLDSEVREMWSGWQARACLDKVKELNQ